MKRQKFENQSTFNEYNGFDREIEIENRQFQKSQAFLEPNLRFQF